MPNPPQTIEDLLNLNPPEPQPVPRSPELRGPHETMSPFQQVLEDRNEKRAVRRAKTEGIYPFDGSVENPGPDTMTTQATGPTPEDLDNKIIELLQDDVRQGLPTNTDTTGVGPPGPGDKPFPQQQTPKDPTMLDRATALGKGVAEGAARTMPMIGPVYTAADLFGTPVSQEMKRSRIADKYHIGTEGVSAAARFNINLALGTFEDEPTELAVVKQAIEKDTGVQVETRIGPQSQELEWRPRGEEQWRFVNGVGWRDILSDLSAAGPEAGTLGAGLLGAAGGAFAGAGAGPVGATMTTAGGAAIAEAFAEYIKLKAAQAQGLRTDLSEDQVQDLAMKRGAFAGGLTVLGGAGVDTFRGLVSQYGRIRSLRGAAERAAGDIEKGRPIVADLQQRVKDATGQDVRFTAGQTAGAAEATAERGTGNRNKPSGGAELRRAEDTAIGMGGIGQPIKAIRDEQLAAKNSLEIATFGELKRDAEVAGAKAVQDTVAQMRRDVVKPTLAARGAARTEAREATTKLGRPKKSEEAAIGEVRSLLATAEDNVFEPYKTAYHKFQNEQAVEVPLAPFRDEVAKIEGEVGHSLLGALSPTASRVLRGARDAGLSQVKGLEFGTDGVLREVIKVVDEPSTLADIMKARASLIRELNRTDPLGLDPKSKVMLEKVRDALEVTLREALPPEQYQRIKQIDMGYREAIERFNKGVVGEVMTADRFGVYTLNSSQGLDAIMASPENARTFVSALSGYIREPGAVSPKDALKQVEGTLRSVQDAILGRVQREFIDENGKVREQELGRWLTKNRDQLSILFHNREDMLLALQTAKTASAAVKRFTEQSKQVLKLFDSRYGVYDNDPAILVSRLVSDGRVRELKEARGILVRSHPHLVERFDTALRHVARSEIEGGGGQITADKVDAFMKSSHGKTVMGMLGERFSNNLTTLRDMLRVADQKVPPGTSREVARTFTFNVPGLAGVQRFWRVVAPPLSPKGRALTATLGVMNEKNQQRIVEAISDPDKLSALVQLTKVDPLSKAGRAYLARVGMDYVYDFWDSSGLDPDEVEPQQ